MNAAVRASALWFTLARLADQLNWHLHPYAIKLRHVCVIKTGIVYVYMVRLDKMVTRKWSRVIFTFQLLLLLLLRNWTICRCLLVRCSLSPTLFIHFWTSTANGSEYLTLHLSAPTGALLVVSCIITLGSFSEGHLYVSSTANRSGSSGGWPWRDATRLRHFKQRPLTWPPQQNSPERSLEFAR